MASDESIRQFIKAMEEGKAHLHIVGEDGFPAMVPSNKLDEWAEQQRKIEENPLAPPKPTVLSEKTMQQIDALSREYAREQNLEE